MKTSVHLFLTDILPEKRRLLHKVVKNKIFGKEPADKAFAEMKKAGIDGIEVLIPSFAKTKDIQDLLEITRVNNIKIYSVHQAWRFLTKTRIFEITKLFEKAKILDAKVIVLHINSAKRQVFNKKYIEDLHSLQDKYGIKVGFENMEKHAGSVMNGRVWNELKFAELMNKNNFSITLDTCHLGQAGGDIVNFFKKNKDRIINIHLSDYKAHVLNNSLRPMRFKHLPLGKGNLPINEFLSTLKSENYQGLLTLEIGANLDDLLQSANIINNTP